MGVFYVIIGLLVAQLDRGIDEWNRVVISPDSLNLSPLQPLKSPDSQQHRILANTTYLMKTKLLIAALFLSVGAFAQTATTPAAPKMKPEMHRNQEARTPEERAEFKAEREAKLAAMTPEQREAAKAKNQGKKQGRMAKMTPEQREKMKAEHKAKMANMTPAERKAFKADMKQKHEARLANMTPEQRAKVEARKNKLKDKSK